MSRLNQIVAILIAVIMAIGVAIGSPTATNKAYNIGLPVKALEFSSDNKTLAVAGTDDFQMDRGSVVVLLNTDTGRPRETIKPKHRVAAVAFSPNGRLLAIATAEAVDELGRENGTVRLWDVPGHKWRGGVLDRHAASTLAFSPDGTLLAMGGANQKNGSSTVRVWNIITRQTKQTFTLTNQNVESLSYTADGRKLICGSIDDLDGYLSSWDLATGKRSAIFRIRSAQAINVSSDKSGFDVVRLAEEHPGTQPKLYDFGGAPVPVRTITRGTQVQAISSDLKIKATGMANGNVLILR